LKIIFFVASVFFPLHSEDLFFSSFSVFFRRGFSSGLRVSAPGSIGAGFEAHEARAASLQVSALHKTLRAGCPQPWAAEVLFRPGVPAGQ
jgi:hypothetical protein